MDKNTELLINDLINKSLDGTITSSESQELNRLVISDKECASYYVSCIKIHYAFSKARHLFRSHTEKSLSDSGLSLQEFAEYEITAPVIQIEKGEADSKQLLEPEVKQARTSRKISKAPIVMAVLSCAALLMMLAYVYLNPQMSEVAILTDSINPQWLKPECSVQIGDRLSTTREPVILKQGIIKILYDNDIEVLIEAPAEYQMQSSKEICLNYGSLYAKVSQAGRGFSVKTQNAKIVDLGTEFGVRSSKQNTTELHVFKGKTTLAATVNNKAIKNIGVIAGQAKEICSTGDIKDIQLKNEVFVKSINSKTNFVWRGQKLDLADMISLGNGLGTGQLTGRISPVSGFTDIELTGDVPTQGYLQLSKSPFIDGIFVPNGTTEQTISSQGDIFEGCPPTSGIYYADVIANPRAGLFTTNTRKGTIQFGGQIYGDRSHPCVVFHANLGVTFNLNAIRAAYPASNITHFVSKIGIADLQEPYPCNADFWVLVDGKIRYCKKNVREKGTLIDISADIQKSDRFLTLVTTDGGDVDTPEVYKRAITCDWCVFTEPALELE
jgi:hypothetical protein